jgi:hypothetical protein
MNQVNKALNRFGLTDNETAVYIEALKHEETSPYALSKATKIPRTTVYDVLMSLSLKGLVTLQQSDGISKQQTKIKAKNPSTLRHILRQKQQDLIDLEIDILDVLPDLKKAYHREGVANAAVKFYPGIEGARQVYYASYLPDVRKDVFVFENMMPMDAFGREEINRDVSEGPEQRLKKGTQVKELMPLNEWTKHVLTYQCGREPNYLNWRNLRYIENSGLMFEQRIVIQGNRIAISTAKDEEAWGLVMNSISLARTMGSLHELLWQQGKPVTKEFVESLGTNDFWEVERRKAKSS